MTNQCKNFYKNSNDIDQILLMIEEMDTKYSKLKQQTKQFMIPFEQYTKEIEEAEQKVLTLEDNYNDLVNQF